MTALGLEVLTLAFPDPDLQSIFPQDFKNVNSSLSYSFAENNKIRTLSTTSSSPGHDIDGLLFVPQLPTGVCDESAQWVPQNATKPADLPSDKDVFWVGLAPWLNANCTLEFFKAAVGTPIQAFLFFLPDNGTEIPPLPNAAQWGLGDGGRWKTQNRYPVYAIPSMTGQALMKHMVDYHGNVTEVPNGHTLANEYPASDYIRLAVEIDIAGGNSLPSLWVFLLIVLGILILIIGSTSCSMHWIQRRRRERLRRRVANGEVDLEALGIKRLTVPQAVVDKMTLYTYPGSTSSLEKGTNVTNVNSIAVESVAGSSTTTSLPGSHSAHFSQATCPICLDDYVPGETTVRELPCRHIYHPECIDSFLRQNSSLCPMCKKTVLPKGYCPAVITNAMVRRERMVRRIRDRVPASESPLHPRSPQIPARSLPRVRDAVRTAVTGSRRVFSAPIRAPSSTPSTQGTEMRSATAPLGVNEIGQRANTSPGQPCAPSPEPMPPRNEQSRREWARQRAVAMLGRRETLHDTEIEAEAARRPGWRRAIGRVFPGFA